MKILIVNQHTNNFGDDAAGTALVNRLLQVGVQKIELLYCMPGFLPIKDKRVIHNHELNVRKLDRLDFFLYWIFGIRRGKFIPNFIEKVQDYDLILVSPCGANLGIYKDWQLLFQDLIVVRKNKKLIFHLNTISPSGNKMFDKLVQFLCKRSCVYVREKASQQYLKSKGILATWGPDSAFMLESRGNIDYDEKRIVFVPSDVWSWHVDFVESDNESYEEKILKPLAQFAQNNDKEIYILAHTNSESEKAFNVATKLKMEDMAPGLTVIIPEIRTVYDYENFIRSSYLLVGMRYHSIVLAAKNAISFISISYERKMQEISMYTNQQKYCIDLKYINQAIPLNGLLDDIASNHTKIQHNLAVQKDRLIQQANVVIEEQILCKR